MTEYLSIDKYENSLNSSKQFKQKQFEQQALLRPNYTPQIHRCSDQNC